MEAEALVEAHRRTLAAWRAQPHPAARADPEQPRTSVLADAAPGAPAPTPIRSMTASSPPSRAHRKPTATPSPARPRARGRRARPPAQLAGPVALDRRARPSSGMSGSRWKRERVNAVSAMRAPAPRASPRRRHSSSAAAAVPMRARVTPTSTSAHAAAHSACRSATRSALGTRAVRRRAPRRRQVAGRADPTTAGCAEALRQPGVSATAEDPVGARGRDCSRTTST